MKIYIQKRNDIRPRLSVGIYLLFGQLTRLTPTQTAEGDVIFSTTDNAKLVITLVFAGQWFNNMAITDDVQR